MPTTEERLAALEKQMAAWMDQRPTTYYTHQYSGEEIDAAVGRALTNGAIDQAVGTFVRPNLLDNWYFGRPVDQRGGKIVQSGVNIYTDSTLKTLIGPAAYACPVVELTSTYAKVRDAKNTGSYYYAAPGDVVRGYTGNGYTVDRWYADDITLTVTDRAIRILRGPKNQWYNRIMQNLEVAVSKEIAGKTCTLSALCKSVSGVGQVQLSLFNITDNVSTTNIYVDLTGAVDLITVTFVVPDSYSGKSLGVFFYPDTSDSSRSNGCDVYAAKLELGPTQTLAHKDAAGNWVLNEVPEYGGQLSRCQRYARAYKCLLGQTFLPPGVYRSDRKVVSFVLPTSCFRATPTVSALNDIFSLFDGANVYPITSLVVSDYSDGLVNIYVYTSQSFENGKVLWLFSNTGTLFLSADL